MPTSGYYDLPCADPGEPCEAVLDPSAIAWEAAWWASDPLHPPGTNTGDAVTAWSDYTGNGHSLAPIDNPPTFVAASGMNLRPAVEFGAGSRSLDVVFGLTIPQPNTVVMILRADFADAQGPQGFALRWFDNLSGVVRQFGGGWDATQLMSYAGGVTQFVSTAPTTASVLTAHIFDGTASAVHQNLDQPETPASPGSGGLDGINVGGAGSTGPGWFQGLIAFCGVYAGDVRLEPAWPAFQVQASHDYDLGF